MKRRCAWRGQWPRKSSFASLRLIVFTCHILLANKNRVVRMFFERFCQVFTPSMKQLIVVGDVLNVEYVLTAVKPCTT